ncbi:MAG: 2-C-methyl-D-erythritol 4-phosphate cytidylyltransferase [Porphyromonadaceae bacterium]|nr:2-C-methyl-D-erythritol 4-phosphate cytidylyltransferase [Porphyromonadaceae bacterium]
MYSAVLLSGGMGTIMLKDIPKQYLLLGGKPMIIHSLDRLDHIEAIDEIVIVCAQEYLESLQLMLYQYNITKKVIFADAGNTRQASVYNGLIACTQDDVIIHEAARPFATTSDFKRLIDAKCKNAILGCDIPYTVVKGDSTITGILNRSELVNVQLPQKFEKSVLLDAHNMAIKEKKQFTEDASMVYYYKNCPIDIIRGDVNNIKITNPSDLIIGEMIYKEYINSRK